MRLLRVAIVVTVVGNVENAGEGLAGVGLFRGRDEFGRALGDDAAAAFAAFGAEVDDPVGLLDDVEVLSNVVEMQAGGGLVEDVERAARLAFGKLASQLDALGFAAGKSCGGLTERDIAEADFDE